MAASVRGEGSTPESDLTFHTPSGVFSRVHLRGSLCSSALCSEGPVTIRVCDAQGNASIEQTSWAVPQSDGSVKLLPMERG